MTIYSGVYKQNFGNFQNNFDWILRAQARQQLYCDKSFQKYKLIEDIPWGKNYPLRESWTFGTLIKLVALNDFIKSTEEYFTWFDLDIYPTNNSFEYSLPKDNLFYAPLVPWSFCTTEHMKCKREWCNHSSDYYAVSSSMYRFTRDTALTYWAHINRDYEIESDKWWEALYCRQLSYSTTTPWAYGTEECLLQEWLNKYSPKFIQLTDDIQSTFGNPLFLHYYGTSKSKYPV